MKCEKCNYLTHKPFFMPLELITIDDLVHFKNSILEEIKKLFQKEVPTVEKNLKSKEVCKLLRVSTGKLQNLRKNKTIPARKIGGTYYYLHEDITNLLPGTEYLLTDKFAFTNDIRKQWRPLFLFTAASNSATFTGTFPENHQFFQVWDWDAYSGPVITLEKPSNGALLGDKIKVTGGVGDIFSDRVAELYVDGDLITAITNGPLSFDLDTQLFTNGVHNLDVVVRTVLLTTNFLEFANVASATVTFSNFLTSIDNGPFFSGGSTILKFATIGTADYTLKIYDGSNVLRRTITGSTGGGVFQVSWDRRDGGGTLLPDEVPYTFEMTATPTGNGFSGGAAAAAASTVKITSFAEGTFNAGFAHLIYCKRVFFSGQYEQTDQELMDRIHAYIYGADLFGSDPADTRGVLNDQVFLWQTDSQKTTILNSIQRKDVGHVFYVGHGSPDQIGAG